MRRDPSRRRTQGAFGVAWRRRRAGQVRRAKEWLTGVIENCSRIERGIVWQAGRRLVADGLAQDSSDACLLGYQEIDDWLQERLDPERVARRLKRRRAGYRRWSRFAPPETLDKASLAPGALEVDSAASGRRLHGLAISPGLARGRARLIGGISQLSSLLPGEVLVCDEPLFEYSPLFSLAVAVVAETGGLLDHAGVLAREYGVPAVFGVARATQEIHNGDPLVVDARQGTVTIAAADAAWLQKLDEDSF